MNKHQQNAHRPPLHKTSRQPTFSELHAMLSNNISPSTWPIDNRRIPKDIVRRNGTQSSLKKKHVGGETTLPPIAPPSSLPLSSHQTVKKK